MLSTGGLFGVLNGCCKSVNVFEVGILVGTYEVSFCARSTPSISKVNSVSEYMSLIPQVPFTPDSVPVNPAMVTADVNAFLTELVPALTNVCADVSDDTPTLTVNVFVVFAVIFNHLSNAGSPPLGYG